MKEAKNTTLARAVHALSQPEAQLALLEGPGASVPPFDTYLKASGLHPYKPQSLDVLQVNIGKMCNQTCHHCHVDAGPDRSEKMSEETMDQCLHALRAGGFQTLDITGGAPELHPLFRDFVDKAMPLVGRIIVRSNLTIIVSNKRFHDLPEFFRDRELEIISSLPFYSRSRTDAQRGEGVFDASIKALRMLNRAGYGQDGSGLQLHLVYNPTGCFLPGDQASLEKEYKRRLSTEHDVVFNSLYTITNMPISRFLESLQRTGNLQDYMERLVNAYNPAAAEAAMCRTMLSVGWDGELYDCDFNQMLEIRADGGGHISSFDPTALSRRTIRTGRHCFGCTAGSGSSCGGTTA